MPLQDHMHLISTDDHLIEHPKLWSDRLPKKFLEAGPKIIEKELPKSIHVATAAKLSKQARRSPRCGSTRAASIRTSA